MADTKFKARWLGNAYITDGNFKPLWKTKNEWQRFADKAAKKETTTLGGLVWHGVLGQRYGEPDTLIINIGAMENKDVFRDRSSRKMDCQLDDLYTRTINGTLPNEFMEPVYKALNIRDEMLRRERND